MHCDAQQCCRDVRYVYLGTYHFFCVCVGGGGGGGVNFEGGTEKGRFDKGGNKIWPKYGKGEGNYEFVQEGNTFFDNPNV